MQTNSSTSQTSGFPKSGTTPGVNLLGRFGLRYDSRSIPDREVAKPVLDNKFGIVSSFALRNLEDRITTVTIPEALKRLSRQETIGLKQVQIAHNEIFKDIYPWAGQLRKTDISKEIPFLPFELIKPKATKAFADFRTAYGAEGNLAKGISNLSADGAAVALAGLYSALNHIHPFREGNGRSNRAVVAAVGRLGGYDLDWTAIADKKETFNAASLEARRPDGSKDPLTELFRTTIVRFDQTALDVRPPESKRKLLAKLKPGS